MGILDRPKAVLHRARIASPPFDHAVRAYGRYSKEGGGRLAATVTLPAFLSFFPLVGVAFLVLAFVLSGSASAQSSVLDGVKTYLPGLLCSTAKGVHGYACTVNGVMSGKIDVNKIKPKSSAGVLSGVIGFLGLVLAGTGWVNNLRTALRSMWHQDQSAGNFLVKKGKDLVILLGLGAALIASVAVAGVATSATTGVLDTVGFGHNGLANLLIKVIGVIVSIAVNVAIFFFLFTRLAEAAGPMRRVLRGSLLAGSLFEVLQVFGATYIAHTTGNPIYGIFAVVIGLVVWIGLVVQITLFAAAWTVTDPYLDDIAPSGSLELHLPSMPEGPGLPPGGLTATAPSDVAARARRRPPEAQLVPEPAGSSAARVAGVAGVGLIAASMAGVAIYSVRTLRDAIR